MNIIVNNVEFDFVRNQYGTHNWICFDYNDVTVIDEDSDEFESRVYLGNLEVIKFINKILPNVDNNQQNILFNILNLVKDSYIKSVGGRFAYYYISYKESLSFSIGNRTRLYQLHKYYKEMLLRKRVARRGARS